VTTRGETALQQSAVQPEDGEHPVIGQVAPALVQGHQEEEPAAAQALQAVGGVPPDRALREEGEHGGFQCLTVFVGGGDYREDRVFFRFGAVCAA